MKQFTVPSDLSKVPTIVQVKKQYGVGERLARQIRTIISGICDEYQQVTSGHGHTFVVAYEETKFG